MKPIFKIIFIAFLTVYSCKKNGKTEPNTNPPKVEFTEFDLGESDLPELKKKVNDF